MHQNDEDRGAGRTEPGASARSVARLEARRCAPRVRATWTAIAVSRGGCAPRGYAMLSARRSSSPCCALRRRATAAGTYYQLRRAAQANCLFNERGFIAKNGVRACQSPSRSFSEWPTIRSESKGPHPRMVRPRGLFQSGADHKPDSLQCGRRLGEASRRTSGATEGWASWGWQGLGPRRARRYRHRLMRV
jgi:hypothetical protein